MGSAPSIAFRICKAFLASPRSNPSIFTASSIRSATSLRVTLYGALNASAADAGAGVWFSLPFDLDRGGCESVESCGLGVELRPLVGLSVDAGFATITSSGLPTELEAARSFFAGFPTDVEDTRFDAGCVGVTSAAALDELDLSGWLREALLLLALAFAAAGCAEGSLLAGLGFAATLGSEAGRFVSSFSGGGADSSFGAEFCSFCAVIAFIVRSIAALAFA